MIKLASGCCLLLISLHCHAEALKADSILCESEKPLALLKQDYLANKPGKVVMQRITDSEKGLLLSAKFHETYKDLMLKEESIRADAVGLRNGSTSARAADSDSQQKSAMADASQFREFLDQCVVNTDQQEIEVMDRKPISKTIHIKAGLGGKKYEFWTSDFYIQ
jgi:hypothetical protein